MSNLSKDQLALLVAAKVDPIIFAKMLWPDVYFYDKQREIIRSVDSNDQTFVVAGNMLGKDYVAGFICLRFFLIHEEVRVVTTSVKDDHLRILWGEIGRFINTSEYPLLVENGGPLIHNHRDISKIVDGKECEISYMRGMVSKKGEGLAGHHAKHTLFVIDEASGVEDVAYTQGETWAKKMLIFGNPNPCPPTHFFRKNVELGDLKAKV